MKLEREHNESQHQDADASTTSTMQTSCSSVISDSDNVNKHFRELKQPSTVDTSAGGTVSVQHQDSSSFVYREHGKNLCKLRTVPIKKTDASKTWRPNGGRIKPYNSVEAQKNAVPVEECIIDVKAVKPKVDTWFKPKKKATAVQEAKKLHKYGKTKELQVRRDSKIRAKVQLNAKSEAKGEGSEMVKNLTSFWNDQLSKNPFLTLNAHKMVSRGQEDDSRLHGRYHEVSKFTSREHMEELQKSVNPDGVVKEHTLVPSKLLAEKKRMTSVADIISLIGRHHGEQDGGMNDSSDAQKQSQDNAVSTPTETSRFSSLVSRQLIWQKDLPTSQSDHGEVWKRDDRLKRFKVLKRLAREGMRDTLLMLNVGQGLRTVLSSPFRFQDQAPSKNGMAELVNKYTQTSESTSSRANHPTRQTSEVTHNLSSEIYWETLYCFQRGSLEVQPCGVRILLYIEYKMMTLIAFIFAGLTLLSLFG